MKALVVLFAALSSLNARPCYGASQRDFFNVVRSRPRLEVTAYGNVKEDCRSHIAKVICLVNPEESEESKNPLDRPCLKGGAAYAHYFETHYDRSNIMIQGMYCHLERIWIEKKFSATAYATGISDVSGGPVTGGAVGIRKEVLDSDSDFDRWLTWKEETNFGGSKVSTDPSVGVLAFRSNKQTHADLLDYILNHEFGHLFDFGNSITKLQDCESNEPSNAVAEPVKACAFEPESFGYLSWTDSEVPRPENRFPGQDDFCFYACDETNQIDPKFTSILYSGLIKSNYISSYAASNPWDDWAETFASYLAYEDGSMQLRLQTGGRRFNIRRHFYSEVMQSKREYVQRFIRGNYKYPGEL
jgi:hypothetical protein